MVTNATVENPNSAITLQDPNYVELHNTYATVENLNSAIIIQYPNSAK